MKRYSGWLDWINNAIKRSGSGYGCYSLATSKQIIF